MAYELKELKGGLFLNTKKKSDAQPDYTGSVKVHGVEYRLSGWVNKTKQGDDYFSLSLTHPEDPTLNKPQIPTPSTGGAQPSAAPPNVADDDDIPF